MKSAYLRDICEFKYGKSLPESKRIVGSFSVFGSNGRVGTHVEPLTKAPAIVIGRKGSVGEINYSPDPCWPIDTTYYIDSSSTSQDIRWLYFALKSLRLTELNKATGVPGLNRNDAYERKLFLPRLEEQRRIAAILDKADGIRRKREATFALADDLLKSVFLDMFGSERWNAKPLSNVVKPGTIVTYGIVQAGPEHPGGIPYIRTGDIKNGKIIMDSLRHTAPEVAEKFARSRVEAGEIVMSIRATVGTTAFVPASLHGANLTQGTARIAPGPETTREYLISFLRSAPSQQWISRHVKGATFREITLSKLRELEIPLPPIDMQKSYSKIYQSTTDIVAQLEGSKHGAEILYSSLFQHACRGEL